MLLVEKIRSQLPEMRDRVRKLVKDHGDVKVGDVSIKQVYGGMRGVKSLVTDISSVDPNEGIRLRGYSIPEILFKLPKLPDHEIPLVGGLYYLLLTGELPELEDSLEVEEIWRRNAEVPGHVFDVIRAMPENTHPMTLFSQAILAMQTDSKFAKKYLDGISKTNYWEPMLEDSINLTARLPQIAAYIYRLKYRNGDFIDPTTELDWAGNFSHMMGVEREGYDDLCRLYMIIHSDHESGNVSAHTTHLVGSTLSDAYYSLSAGINGLAGPLHGLANQQSLGWLLKIYEQFNRVPSKEELRNYANETLDAGQVIPGYGHAVLKRTDPRFIAQMEFAEKHFPEDDIYKLVKVVYEIIPDVLLSRGKARNPWANVDAISGALQYHYGVKEFDFYTVLFGLSRALGVTANLIWSRALGQPIERPKSLTTEMLEGIV